MKFEAQKIDLTLELVTLTGEEIVLSPSELMTAKKCLTIIEEWRTLEDNSERTEMGTMKDGVVIMAIELSIIYDRTKEWFLENFDILTLKNILAHVANTMGGIRKKLDSST